MTVAQTILVVFLEVVVVGPIFFGLGYIIWDDIMTGRDAKRGIARRGPQGPVTPASRKDLYARVLRGRRV